MSNATTKHDDYRNMSYAYVYLHIIENVDCAKLLSYVNTLAQSTFSMLAW